MKSKKGNVLILTGLLLIAAAFFLTVYNLYDDRRAQQSVSSAVTELEAYIPEESAAEKVSAVPSEPVPEDEIEIPDYILNPEMDMPVEEIDGAAYIGLLEIPACDLKLPVLSAWSYPNLKIAPCRYEGSAYLDNLIIAGHNYTSHFGKLQELAEGERVTFTDVDGNIFYYTVAVREILESTAIEEMASGDWDLTLFTCTLNGQSRVTIRCLRDQ